MIDQLNVSIRYEQAEVSGGVCKLLLRGLEHRRLQPLQQISPVRLVIDGDAGMRGLSAGGPLATDNQRGTAFLCLRAGEVVGIRGLRPIGIGVPYGYPAASVVLQGSILPTVHLQHLPGRREGWERLFKCSRDRRGRHIYSRRNLLACCHRRLPTSRKRQGQTEQKKQRFFHFVTPLTTMVGFLYPQHLQ